MSHPPPLLTYQQAEDWLLSITDYERLLGSPTVKYDTQTFDLDRFRQQLSLLGDPHLRYGVIHVAGTKGKGSTCAFLESALRACGLKTGLYTSPHLVRFTERIRINGAEIPETDFCRLVEFMGRRLAKPAAAAPPPDSAVPDTPPAGFRTVFEILTAAAFQYFAEQQVDVAIIETGLGGRLDSTNMFDGPGAGPLIDVITAIGLDHTAILGNTTTAIAREKAGIIRPHARTVVAMQPDANTEEAVREVVMERCSAIRTAEKPTFVSDAVEITGGPEQFQFRWKMQPARELGFYPETPIEITPGLRGAHQAQNCATALVALSEFASALAQSREKSAGSMPHSQQSHLSLQPIIDGLQQTCWPGRIEIFKKRQVPVIVDGAHCALSAAALARACREIHGQRPAVLVTGFLRDKAGSEILNAMFEQVPVQAAVAIAPPTPRSASVDEIRSAILQHLPPDAVTSATSMAGALDHAISRAEQCGGYVVVYGSLYLVGPARELCLTPA